MSFYLFFLCGVLGGVLGGMGMGGGTALIPLLTLLLGVPQAAAQGVNLLSFFPMAALALTVHAKNGLLKKEGAPLFSFCPHSPFPLRRRCLRRICPPCFFGARSALFSSRSPFSASLRRKKARAGVKSAKKLGEKGKYFPKGYGQMPPRVLK